MLPEQLDPLKAERLHDVARRPIVQGAACKQPWVGGWATAGICIGRAYHSTRSTEQSEDKTRIGGSGSSRRMRERMSPAVGEVASATDPSISTRCHTFDPCLFTVQTSSAKDETRVHW